MSQSVSISGVFLSILIFNISGEIPYPRGTEPLDVIGRFICLLIPSVAGLMFGYCTKELSKSRV